MNFRPFLSKFEMFCCLRYKKISSLYPQNNMKLSTNYKLNILNIMNITAKRFFSLILFIVVATSAFSQQVGANSPYGRYGYGQLSNQTFGASEAMGGISYGIRRSQQVNPGNPASYSKLDTLTMIFDFGVSAQYSELSDGINKQHFWNGNLDYVAIQFPIIKKIGASAGIIPFSKTGYSFGQSKSSGVVYDEVFRGDGGLSRIYAGIAYEPIKYISIGANVNYLFGSFTYSSVSMPVSSTGSTIGEERKSYSIRDFNYDLGAQFTLPIDRESAVTLGVVFAPKMTTKSDVYITEKMFMADPYLNPGVSPSEVLRDDTLSNRSFQLPNTLGAGITYSNKNLLVGVDGTVQQWSGLKYPSELDGLNENNRFNNAYLVSAGAEYIIDPYSRNFFQRIRFRAGLSYGNSYINANVSNPSTGVSVGVDGYKEYGASFGIGLPYRDFMTGRLSLINIGFSYTTQRPNLPNMIKQDIFKVSLNMNINEFWFNKRKFN